MKRILVATDFSVPADNAVNYAAELAKNMNVELTILNCFHIPISTAETPLPIITINELEKNSKMTIEEHKKNISKKFPKLSIHIHSCAGFAVEEIASYAKAHHVDLIVMGITGAGRLSERLFGSTSVSVVNNTQCPVLIIPQECQFKKPGKIGFASDFKEIIHPSGFHILKELIAHFESSLEVLNVLKPEGGPTIEKAIAGVTLENIFNDIPYSLHFPEDKDVIHGIEDFTKRHKIDIITMVSRRHNIFDKIIHESNTKRMAFHTPAVIGNT